MHSVSLRRGLLALLLAGAVLAPIGSPATQAAPAPIAACTPVDGFQRWLLSQPRVVDSHFGASLAIADFNRDGAGDLAVGAPRDLGGGQVYVYPGGLVGPGVAAALAHDAATGFGTALATGDVNHDGYPDLVVGAPGAVVLFRGGPGGLATGTRYEAGMAAGDRLGAALAVGDVNGDGYADVAAGAPGRRSGAGGVVVFAGSAAGLGQRRLIVQEHNGGRSEPGDRFGAALAAGDLDGDGQADVVIGAPGEAPGRARAGGAVTVVRGRGPATVITQASLGGAVERGDQFGAALAIGDVNGDRRPELAIGVPGEAPGAAPAGGVTHIVDGALLRQEAAGALTGRGDAFGTAIAIADIDRDGAADVVVGAPGDNDAVLLGGSRTGVHAGRPVTESLTIEPGARMGAVVAIGDLTGDGRPEVVIAAPDMLVAGHAGSGAVRVVAGLTPGLAGVAVVGAPTRTAAVIEVRTTRPVAARVQYRQTGSAAPNETPWTTVNARSRMVLSGLRPATSYEYRGVVGCEVDPLSGGTFRTA
jgi:hypothetical protein